jgi:hypothetical protein
MLCLMAPTEALRRIPQKNLAMRQHNQLPQQSSYIP